MICRFCEGLGVLQFTGATSPAGLHPQPEGNFRVGLRTEKSRLRRALQHAQDLMRRMRHLPVQEQVDPPQSCAPQSLWVLRHCREHPGTATESIGGWNATCARC